VLGWGSAANFDEAHRDFDVSDSAGFEGEQHELSGFVAAYSGLGTVEQEVVGSESGSEGASVASTLGCVTAITLLFVSVGCSVRISGGTLGLTVVLVVFFGPQQPPPQVMMRLWLTKV